MRLILHLQSQVSKSSTAALFLNLPSDIKITSEKYLLMRIKFAPVKYFQGQEGRQCVPATCSTSADSARPAVQAMLLLQSTLQPQAVKSLRGILHPVPSLLLHLFPQSLCKQQSEDSRPSLIPEINYDLENTVIKLNKQGEEKEKIMFNATSQHSYCMTLYPLRCSTR